MVSVWGKLGGAGLGYAVGGPLGALLGAFAGHVLVDRDGAWFGPAPKDVIFTTGLIALSAKMAKADGVVLRSEVDAFERLVEVPPAEHRNVVRLFDLAKATTDGFEAYAGQIADAFRDEPALLEDLVDGLFDIAVADGFVHEAEPGRAPRRPASGYHPPALHRHARRERGPSAPVQPGREGLVPLPRVRGRAHGATRAGGASRLACRDFVLGGPHRRELALDRDRDRQSRSRWRASALSAGADRQGDRALPRSCPALVGPRRPGHRPFRRRSRLQG